VTRGRLYRALVPGVLIALAVITLAVLVLASGVLVGLIPYPGR
jgi:hypothetical protein